MTTIERTLEDLAEGVEQAKAALDAADAEPARQAVQSAAEALRGYELRVADGELPVTPATLGNKRDNLALAELALPAAEKRETDARAAYKDAVVGFTVAQVVRDPELGSEAEQAVKEKALALLRQARELLEDHAAKRNAALSTAMTRLSECGAPTASNHAALVLHESPESPVHLLTSGGGILVNGREVARYDPVKWSKKEFAKTATRMIPVGSEAWRIAGLQPY